MRFRYVAYTLDQGIIKGKVEAQDTPAARTEVGRQGYKPLRIAPVRRLPTLEEIFPSLASVSTSELVRFSRQMATMLNSGGNLLRSLEMIGGESRTAVMRRTLDAMRKKVDEGGSLSAALADHARVFNPLFVRVVEVGEYTGRLGPALDQMAEILEKEHEAKQKAMRTMMYPLAIMGLSLVTLGVLMTVALPPLLTVFKQMGTDVPLMTQIAIALVGGLKDNFLTIILGAIGFVVVLRTARRVPRVRYALDAAQTRAPLIGSFIVAGELARFSRTMAMLLEAGVSLATALPLARSGCKNGLFHRAFLDAEESLMNGNRLTEALKRYRIFPTMFVQLVLIGEEANSLRSTMTDAANAYQRQLEQQLNSLLGVLEPASTVVVGGIVAFIAFSMFTPIYSGLNALP